MATMNVSERVDDAHKDVDDDLLKKAQSLAGPTTVWPENKRINLRPAGFISTATPPGLLTPRIGFVVKDGLEKLPDFRLSEVQ